MKLYTNFLTAIAMGENLTKDLFQFCKLRKHDNSTRRLSFHCHSSLCPQGLVSVGIYSIHICCKTWAIYFKFCLLVQLCCIQENKWLPILKIWDEILTTLYTKKSNFIHHELKYHYVANVTLDIIMLCHYSFFSI